MDDFFGPGRAVRSEARGLLGDDQLSADREPAGSQVIPGL